MSENYTYDWEKNSFPLGFRAIEYHKLENGTILASSESGVWRNEAGDGLAWEKVSSDELRYFYSKGNIVVATVQLPDYYENAMVSSDGGATWRLLRERVRADVGEVAVVGNGRIILNSFDGDDENVYYTDDLGENWSVAQKDGEYSYLENIKELGDGVILASNGNGYNSGGIMRSTDYGATWVQDENITELVFEFFVLPNGNVFAKGWSRALVSSDSGATWTDSEDYDGPVALLAIEDGYMVSAGRYNSSNHRIMRSLDNGLTWVDDTDAPSGPYEGGISFPNGEIWAFKDASGTSRYENVQVSTNEGVNWTTKELEERLLPRMVLSNGVVLSYTYRTLPNSMLDAFLGFEGFEALCKKLNQKVAALQEMPSSWKTVNGVVLYIGSDTDNYKSGHLYKWREYQGSTYWTDITLLVDQTYNADSENAQSGKAVAQAVASVATTKISTTVKPKIQKAWLPKTWSGLSEFQANRIWTDGNNIYYSNATDQYVLNVATSTWSSKTWSVSTLTASYIWTNGTNIYYSDGTTQYVLDVATSTWSPKTWSGLTSFDGSRVWTDGNNIYYSDGSNQYVLDVATDTWSPKTWSGLSSFTSGGIWTDGTNIYHSNGTNQYVLNVATSTWSSKTWSGFSNLYASSGIWTDGTNIYYSYFLDQYVLDVATSTWLPKTWLGFSNLSGGNIWTDGTNLYYSTASYQYVLGDKPSTRT